MGFVVLHPAYSLSWLGFSGPYVIIVLPLKTYILYLSLLQEVTKSLTSLYPMQKGRNADACYFANEATFISCVPLINIPNQQEVTAPCHASSHIDDQYCSLFPPHSRINYDVACPMNFEKYPYDTQTCKVKYESCKFS